ncbi:MAG TPA: hypothetical protein VKR32_10555 [Puia sp.]|nr:hypothetical protein [Puia sp.]
MSIIYTKLIFTLLFTVYSLAAICQPSLVVSSPDIGLTNPGGKLGITVYKDGRHSFSYQNQLAGRPDERYILFTRRSEAAGFMDSVKKAFSLKENQKEQLHYQRYRITLYPCSIGVYMKVDEKGRSMAGFTITKAIYKDADIFK